MYTDVEKAYEMWAQNYDHDTNRTRDLCLKICRQYEEKFTGKKIVEAGCGTGNHTLRFAGLAQSVFAFDFSESMLCIARSKVKKDNVTFVRHDITKEWPIPNNFCDYVVINLVLEHIENIHFIFNEAFRILRKQGEMLVRELHPEKQKNGSKARFIDPDTEEQSQIVSYFHSKEEFKNAGKNVGFCRTKMTDWYDDDSVIPRILSISFMK